MISGPGGVGKGTVVRELIARDSSLWLSRSWTTREPRPGEGDDAYVFVDRPTFEAHRDVGGFLEHAEFLGNLYGTPVPDVDGDRDVVLEIDVQGARQVVEHDPDALFVFLLPPSPEEQHRRLLGRGDDPVKARERLDVAAQEHAIARKLHAVEIVNDDLETTIAAVAASIAAARQHGSATETRP